MRSTDPTIFLHRCAVFDVVPSAATHVGSRLHTGAIGAAGAGLAGVWLNRPGPETPERREDARAANVTIIRSLFELPDLLWGRD